jgi:hypothetical protein
MSSKWLVAIGIVVSVLVGVALLVGFTAGPPREYPADTPEGAVQRFLRAVGDADGEAAYAYLAPSVRGRCTYDDFRNQMFSQQVKDSTVTLDRVRVTGDRAEVIVRIGGFRGPRGPFPPIAPGSGDDTWPYTFMLVQAEGQWQFSQIPWPVWGCPEPRKPVPATPTTS